MFLLHNSHTPFTFFLMQELHFDFMITFLLFCGNDSGRESCHGISSELTMGFPSVLNGRKRCIIAVVL